MLYFGTLAVIGLSAPVGHYSSFVDHYLNFIPGARYVLLYGTKYLLALFGYDSYVVSSTQLRMINGAAVNLVYSCIGYGVTSFWLAFVFANKGGWKKKLLWMVGGTLLIGLINISRIGLVLLSNSKHWKFPFGWDNHTWFNIVAYLAIFIMIWFFDRAYKKRSIKTG